MDYKVRVYDNICDPEVKTQLLDDVEDLLSRCRKLHDNTKSDALCDPIKNCPFETELGPEDSVSPVASCQGAMSTTSSKLLAYQIDLDRRRAELRPGFNPLIPVPSVPSLISTKPIELLCRASNISTTDLFCFVKKKNRKTVEAFLQFSFTNMRNSAQRAQNENSTATKTATQP